MHQYQCFANVISLCFFVEQRTMEEREEREDELYETSNCS